jgi:hypothetical protein
MNKLLTFAWLNATTIGLIILSFSIFKACDSPAPALTSVSKPRTIHKTIQKEKQIVNNYVREVDDLRGVIVQMDKLRDQLLRELSVAKNKRDTVLVVQTQDEVIKVLLTQHTYKDSVIDYQSAIIDSQGRIIASQDTLLVLSKQDLKKVKRQRNWAFISNGVLIGLLVIK